MRGKIEPRQQHPLPCMPNTTAFNPWPRYVCRIHSCWMAAQGTHLCFRALRALITLVLCLGYALLSAVLFLAVDVNRDPLCQPHVIVGSRSSLKVSMTWIATLFCSSKAMDPFPRWECTRAKQSPSPCDIERVPLRDFFRFFPVRFAIGTGLFMGGRPSYRMHRSLHRSGPFLVCYTVPCI